MTSSESDRSGYGSQQWLETRFRGSAEDPWGLSWRGIELNRYRRAISILARTVPPATLGSGQMEILDVGCATGHFTVRLLNLSPQVLGIDLSGTAVERARGRHPQVLFRQAAITDSSIVGQGYDLICCLEMLYYVPTDDRPTFVTALRDALKPGGMALVSSMIGAAPYFQPEELHSLLARQLSVRTTVFYGCATWARVEQQLVDCLQRFLLFRRVLEKDPETAHEAAAKSKNLLKRSAVRLFASAAARGGWIRALALGLAGAPSWVLAPLLRLELPAAVFDALAERFSLRRTHTLLMVENGVDRRTASDGPLDGQAESR